MEKLKQKKTNRGVTLIALVVTIVILIILSGVTIGNIISKKSLIKEANNSKEQVEQESLESQVEMTIVKAKQKYTKPTLDNIIEELKNNEIISDASQVNRETGAITTDLGYVIEGKLNDYIENANI